MLDTKDIQRLNLNWVCYLLGFGGEVSKHLEDGCRRDRALSDKYIANIVALIVADAVEEYQREQDIAMSMKSVTSDKIIGTLDVWETIKNNGFELGNYTCNIQKYENNQEICEILNYIAYGLRQLGISENTNERLMEAMQFIKTSKCKEVSSNDLARLALSPGLNNSARALLDTLESVMIMGEYGEDYGLTVGLTKYIEQGNLFEKAVRKQFIKVAKEYGWEFNSGNRQIKYSATRDCNNTPRMMSDIYCIDKGRTLEIIGECKFSKLKGKYNRDYTNQLKGYVMEQRDNKESNKVFGVLIYPNFGLTECVTECDSDMCITQMYIDILAEDIDKSLKRFRDGVRYIIEHGTTWRAGIDDLELRKITLCK